MQREPHIVACRLLAVLFILACVQGLHGSAANARQSAGTEAGLHSLEAMPARLSRHDIKLYRQIFALQERAQWADADRLIAELSDQVLLSYVLYQRYMHPTGYRARFEELCGWLERYADHPDAERVYSLALRRRPAGAASPHDPVRGYLAGAGQELQERGAMRNPSGVERSPVADALVEDWRNAIGELAADGRAEAERELRRPEIAQLVDQVEIDLANWSIARGYLAAGDAHRALVLAGRAAARSGRAVPEIHWAAGLSAWRVGQIGETAQAEREIRKLAARATPELMAGLVALAKSLDLPATQMRLAQSLGRSDGRYDLSALFPVPNWQPANGYTLDRALVFAFMRAESGFDPRAESQAGARGVMQVMPATAQFIAARSDLQLPHGNALFEPETSILFGQAYLEHLLQLPSIGDNLIYLAAAYNAGPARVLRWQETLPSDDPLLFLESIPMREPRAYVKKILTNLWTYRARFGQPQLSQALARGRWPAYQQLDQRRETHAWN
jgi:peptidoglycan lytic transglycosylase